MMSSASYAAVTNAFTLSHVGVSFMEQGCYEQAIETMKDALSLLKQSDMALMSPSRSSSSSSSSSSVDDCDSDTDQVTMKYIEKVNGRCMARLANLKYSTQQIHNNNNNNNSNATCPDTHRIYVQTISDDWDDLLALDSMVDEMSSLESSKRFCILKLVHSETSNYMDSINFDSLCLVLIHNMAIAYLCLSSLDRTVTGTTTEKAIQLLQMSYSLLQNDDTIVDKDNCMLLLLSTAGYIQHPEMIIIMERILCNLVSVSYCTNQEGDVKVYCKQLYIVRKHLKEIQKKYKCHWKVLKTTAPAA